MSQSAHAKGKAFEHRVKRYFEKLGYLVHRSYNSESPFDLICVAPKSALSDSRTLLVQCKSGQERLRPSDIQKMIDQGGHLNARLLFVGQSKFGELAFKEYTPLEVRAQ